MPIRVPIAPATMVPVRATISEIRAPYISRLSTSRPRKSVPSGALRLPPSAQNGGRPSTYGQLSRPNLAWHSALVGGTGEILSCGAIIGASSATSTRTATTSNGRVGNSRTMRSGRQARRDSGEIACAVSKTVAIAAPP